MSWSISEVVGTPEKIVAHLDAQGSQMSGQSKAEFEDAKPHIAALLSQNFQKREGARPKLIKFAASGSGSISGDQEIERSCKVLIEPVWLNFL